MTSIVSCKISRLWPLNERQQPLCQTSLWKLRFLASLCRPCHAFERIIQLVVTMCNGCWNKKLRPKVRDSNDEACSGVAEVPNKTRNKPKSSQDGRGQVWDPLSRGKNSIYLKIPIRNNEWKSGSSLGSLFDKWNCHPERGRTQVWLMRPLGSRTSLVGVLNGLLFSSPIS